MGMMKAAILMTSVAAAALASPAFAGPDRYDQGYGCTGMSGAECVQDQMRLDDGNRATEKSGTIDNGGIGGSNAGGSLSASRSESSDSDDNFGDEVGDTANNAADEAGDEISNAANEAGDAIDDAADEAGDAISEVFD
jgi:hypothetical protein